MPVDLKLSTLSIDNYNSRNNADFKIRFLILLSSLNRTQKKKIDFLKA